MTESDAMVDVKVMTSLSNVMADALPRPGLLRLLMSFTPTLTTRFALGPSTAADGAPFSVMKQPPRASAPMTNAAAANFPTEPFENFIWNTPLLRNKADDTVFPDSI